MPRKIIFCPKCGQSEFKQLPSGSSMCYYCSRIWTRKQLEDASEEEEA